MDRLKPRREIVRHFRCHKNCKPLLQLRDYWQKLSMQTFGPTFRSRRAKTTPGSVAEVLEMISTRGYFFSTTKFKTCSVRLAYIHSNWNSRAPSGQIDTRSTTGINLTTFAGRRRGRKRTRVKTRLVYCCVSSSPLC